jgi:energy-coupling factor transporter ATP-binding protein EcfA2
MGIDFTLRQLNIEGFRGIRTLSLDLPQRQVAALIGGNNAGKSTIVQALVLALQGPSSKSFSPEGFDFYHHPDGTPVPSFKIELMFGPDAKGRLPAVRGAVGDPVEVHGVQVKGSHDRSGRANHSVSLIDKTREPILLLQAVPLKGEAREQWKDHGLGAGRRYARWQDLDDKRPEVWLLQPDNLHVSLFTWKTGPLLRLASMLSSQFFETKWAVEIDGKSRKMPDTMQAAHRFLVAAVQEFPFWKDDLRPRLQDTLSKYLGRQARMELRPAIETLQQWLAQQLAMSFAADAGGAVTPLEKMGHGWQSLVRIAALDVLSQYPDELRSRIVLAFEEPETYLHPHLVRKLRGVLERLAAGGWTVLATTHSPHMVSLSTPQTIVRLARVAGDVAAKTLQTADVDGAAKFQERLDERGAHEMLFAQRVVLCEGQDDTFAVRTFLTEFAKDLDLDGSSVSITRCGDVKQLVAFARMAANLGIPWCALHDEDRLEDGTLNPSTDAVRSELTKLKSEVDAVYEWPGNLELCWGFTNGKAQPARQAERYAGKSLDELTQAAPALVATCELIAGWLRS